MAKTEYTLRNFLQDVIATEGVADKVKAYAEGEIAKLDARNEKRKGAQSKTAKENAPLKEQIVAYVAENPGKTAKEIAEAVGLTPAKVTALATQLRKDEVLVAAEVKVEKRKVLAYTKA